MWTRPDIGESASFTKAPNDSMREMIPRWIEFGVGGSKGGLRWWFILLSPLSWSDRWQKTKVTFLAPTVDIFRRAGELKT